jgi:cell division initiation protein
MITPLDIQSKEFKKTLNGYKSKDVDEFLDNINDDYERLYRENIELKDKIGILTDQIRQYNNLEETLKSTLVMAQSTADDVTSSARKKAELIIEDAEIHAKNLINDAQDHVKEINREYDYLKKEMFIFKTRYQSFIQAQLISLEEFYRDYEDKEIEMLIETEEIEQNNIEESNIEENSVEDIDNLGA